MAATYTQKGIDYSISFIAVLGYTFFIATAQTIDPLWIIPLLVQFFLIKIDIRVLLLKLIKVNIFIALTFLILYLEGNAQLAFLVFIRANLILWFTLAFDFNGFNIYRAMNNLHISKKFSMILFFSVKYIEIFVEEYRKMESAVRIRGFHPAFRIDTFKVYADMISFMIFKTIRRLNQVEDLIVLRCNNGGLIPPSKIDLGLREFIFLVSIAGVIIGYYIK